MVEVWREYDQMLDQGHCYVKGIGRAVELSPHGDCRMEGDTIRYDCNDYEASSTRLLAIQ